MAARSTARQARRSIGGPLLLYLLIALGILWPYRSGKFRSAGDLTAVLGGIVEARRALAEGQFPIRVAPTQLEGSRYPIFQFYGNVPYTAAGALHLFGAGPYTAWKLVVFACLVAGGWFTYLCALRLTRRTLPSVLAGVIFLTAPYVFTDLNARGAFTELIALCLLPGALYFTFCCFASPRPRYVIACAVAWALLGLSHNITYLYGALFIGLFVLSFARPTRRLVGRLARLAAAGALHGLLLAWYIVPQLYTLASLEIQKANDSPFALRWLTPLRILLSPRLLTPPVSSTPNLGLQVGVPILLSFALGLIGLFNLRRARGRRGHVVRLLLLVGLAFFVVWSPIDFWRHLPALLYFVQFPYRVLMFVMLFGALLAAASLALWLGPELPRWRWAFLLVVVGVAVRSYLPPPIALSRALVKRQTVNPLMGGLVDYLLTTAATSQSGSFHPDVDFSGWEFGITSKGLLRRDAEVWLPPPGRATRLVIAGEVPPDHPAGVRLTAALADQSQSVSLPPGPFSIALPVAAGRGGRPLFFTLHADDADSGPAALPITRIAFEPRETSEDGATFVSARQISSAVRLGRQTRCRYVANGPVLLQLPVLCYPRLLDVHDNGREIPYGNVGRFVALQLPQGVHDIEVRFVGVRWANALSLLGWIAVAAFAAIALLQRLRSGKWPGRRKVGAPRFFAADALWAWAALAVGVGIAWGVPRVGTLVHPQLATRIWASRRAGEELKVEYAFDDNPDTAWSANGPAPVTLTIVPAKTARLEGIELEARQTGLYEAWHRVRVTGFLEGAAIFTREFRFPEPSGRPLEQLTLRPVPADRIEIEFSDPIVVTRDGRRLPPEAVNPGYREIRLKWAR